jgi:hypothetical protein
MDYVKRRRFPATKVCQLANKECMYYPDHEAEASYAATGPHVISSAVVALAPGNNNLEVSV